MNPGTALSDQGAREGTPGTDPTPAPQRSGRLWALLALIEVAVFLLAMAAAGLALEAAARRVPSTGSKAAHAIGAILVLALMVVCARWGARVGGRLRRGRAIAMGTTLAIFVLFAVISVVTAIVDHSAATRSAYTQAHGVRATALVLVVGERKQCGAGTEACEYTALILAELSPPVNGSKGTFIHYPGYSKLDRGQHVTVLVDPRDPRYSEIPGARFEPASRWIVWAMLAAVFILLSAYQLRAVLRLRRRPGDDVPSASSHAPDRRPL